MVSVLIDVNMASSFSVLALLPETNQYWRPPCFIMACKYTPKHFVVLRKPGCHECKYGWSEHVEILNLSFKEAFEKIFDHLWNTIFLVFQIMLQKE